MCKHPKHHIKMSAWCCHYWQKLLLGEKEEVYRRTLPPIAQPVQAVWNLVSRHIIVNLEWEGITGSLVHLLVLQCFSHFNKKTGCGSPAHLLQSSSDSHISIKKTGCWIIGSLAHLLQSHGHSCISIKNRLLGHWHICYSLAVILTFQ